MVKRVRCSDCVTENHSLVRLMPSLTSICSNSGTCRMNSACCSPCAEPHHAFDACAVVPGPVEQHDLACGGQVVDVALEVPLRAFAFGGLLQRDDACTARVEMLHEPLDGAALARGVAALEHDDVPVPVGLAPLLQLQQFDLQQPLLLLVVGARHARRRTGSSPATCRPRCLLADEAAPDHRRHHPGPCSPRLCQASSPAKPIDARVRRSDAQVNGRCVTWRRGADPPAPTAS